MEDRFACDNVKFNPLRSLRFFVVDFLFFWTSSKMTSCRNFPFVNAKRVNSGLRFEIRKQRSFCYKSSEIKTVKTNGRSLPFHRQSDRSDPLSHYYTINHG